MRGRQISGGFGFPLGSALGVVATVLAVVLGATRNPELSVVAMVAVVDAMAMLTTARATVATAAVCWCLHAGFVLGRHGDLAFTPQSGRAALVLVLNALGALVIASAIRAATAYLHEREYDPRRPRIPAQLRRVPTGTRSQQ